MLALTSTTAAFGQMSVFLQLVVMAKAQAVVSVYVAPCVFGKAENNLDLSEGVGPLEHILVIPRHPAIGL